MLQVFLRYLCVLYITVNVELLLPIIEILYSLLCYIWCDFSWPLGHILFFFFLKKKMK